MATGTHGGVRPVEQITATDFQPRVIRVRNRLRGGSAQFGESLRGHAGEQFGARDQIQRRTAAERRRQRVVGLARQREIEQVDDDRVDDLAGVQQFERRLPQRARLQVRPERVLVQEVLVLHRVEERFDGDVAESESEVRSQLRGVAVEWADGRRELRERLLQVRKRARPVPAGAKRGGADLPDTLVPIVGQIQRRRFGDGVEMAGSRLLVVIGRGHARRAGGARDGGRMPERTPGVQPGGRLVAAERERVVRRRRIRAEQDQFAGHRCW